MTVTRGSVSFKAIAHLGMQCANTGLTTGTTNTRCRVGDQVSHIDTVGLKQRQKAELNTGWVTAWAGDKASAFNRFAVHFRQAIDRLRYQVASTVGLAVPALPEIRISNSKVSGEIYNLDPTL